MASTMPTCEPSFMALQAALAASIAKGTFVDTTYYLYSQRASDGKARSPRPVFANSAIMRSSPELVTHGVYLFDASQSLYLHDLIFRAIRPL